MLRFVVIDPVNVFPGDYNSLSPLEPDYFRPRWWWVLGQRVHASRLIRLVANECPVLLRPVPREVAVPFLPEKFFVDFLPERDCAMLQCFPLLFL